MYLAFGGQAVGKLCDRIEERHLMSGVQAICKRKQAFGQGIDHAQLIIVSSRDMGVTVDNKSTLFIDFCIEKGVAEGNPQIGNLQVLILEVNQHHRSRVSPIELSALTVQALEQSF